MTHAPGGGADVVDLRPFMTEFPTGVAVVTALAAHGRPWGMTCTSLCSVTLSPPMLIVCLRDGSPTLAAVLGMGTFAVNLLHRDARPTAELFASGEPDRFAKVDWTLPAGCGGPHLPLATHMVADCELAGSQVVGDHIVVFGEVSHVTRTLEITPLLYGRRRYAPWPDQHPPSSGFGDPQ
ncbi:flavin reductase family protein [Sphaerisporangium corydalis]|uniref:Flavin reductase family protein n=1 Tax=Sphaerisporangium corydalis TaxID=1441875 RepID=A0ABV9EDU7_9ACTN|nr:flavin reductase family protein [Sphaerisporangium corydalis]